MKAKPSGGRFRNLYAYRGSVWYERRVGATRHRLDLETTSWHDAADRRDAWEELRGIPPVRTRTSAADRVPTFAQLTERYLEEDVGHLAATTRTDRRSHLQADGPILEHFGAKPLDEINAGALREWWNAEIHERGRSSATGRRYLASIAAVFNYAVELGKISESPVDVFRRHLSRRSRSKQGRAAEGAKVRPIADRDAVARLVAAAEGHGAEVAAFVLVLLDAGLRFGEASALRWRSVVWGVDETDPRRHLFIDATRSRGAAEDAPTKSGRERCVQLSRRLRAALGSLYLARNPRPGRDDRIFPSIEPRRFREGPWAAILAEADLAGVLPKDLRDTFASQLVSVGIPVAYVSRQLGHSTIAVTEKHYARWLPGGGDFYLEPARLEPGEVPADLLARLPESPEAQPAGDPRALPAQLALGHTPSELH